MKYTKQPLSVAAQIQLLQTRGLTIADTHEAESTLSQIGFQLLNPYQLNYTGSFVYCNISSNQHFRRINSQHDWRS